MVIVVRNGIGESSSNPGQGYLHFTNVLGKDRNSSVHPNS